MTLYEPSTDTRLISHKAAYRVGAKSEFPALENSLYSPNFASKKLLAFSKNQRNPPISCKNVFTALKIDHMGGLVCFHWKALKISLRFLRKGEEILFVDESLFPGQELPFLSVCPTGSNLMRQSPQLQRPNPCNTFLNV